MIRRLAVVGLGLLGGSVAKAVRERGLAREVVAVGRRIESLTAALSDGAVHRITTDLADGLAGADVVLLATPVATAEGLLPKVWQAAADGAVITDVGSTKGPIVRCAEALPTERSVAFVGSHPMAGSELSGYGVSRADLFPGALVIVTPTERTDPLAVKRVSEFWEALGCRVSAMDPDDHDRAAAAVSHLPHLVAYALVEAVARLNPSFFGVAARGFKDTTRIAASDARVWREIFLSNRAALGEALEAFRAALGELDRLVAEEDGEGLELRLDEIRRRRSRLE
ncbi:MAG: prephenate dehydrogenase/arogenate dehydrogenase family protein [Candidatus Rokubacteria bacterium]|nr:prephenate dehydrogenase/arogenate dehydrogenase family protein [Candidatus Rokubacteria bacterium]MBI2554723.1 prephenate dehydrogenase/arogenate dehydrogenase family protein [Candidatus Rokubacteria bacterium]